MTQYMFYMCKKQTCEIKYSNLKQYIVANCYIVAAERTIRSDILIKNL